MCAPSTRFTPELLGAGPEVLLGGQWWGIREQEVWAEPAAAPLLLGEWPEASGWADLAPMVFEAV